MTSADYVLSRLSGAGIDTAFVVYGGAISELMEAFSRQSAMRYVVTQHEQAAGFCAEGYAKAKGVPGVAFATSGPGGGNLVTPIQNCYYDSVPAIFVTGQVNSKFMRPSEKLRQLGFQETPIVEIVRPITKFAGLCLNPAAVRYAIGLALEVATRDRPGPCLIDIPIDVQRMAMT